MFDFLKKLFSYQHDAFQEPEMPARPVEQPGGAGGSEKVQSSTSQRKPDSRYRMYPPIR